jgi:hypothetical protein
MASVSLLALLCLGACGGDDGGGSADARSGADGPGGSPPEITQVKWTKVGACTASVSSGFTVEATVTDPDTSADQLTFQGTLSGCTPSGWSTRVTTITCPNVSPYNGQIVVRDPQGNADNQAFTISPCQDGMAP